MKIKRVYAMIPCLNEEVTIGKTIKELYDACPKDVELIVYVGNNNSIDNTKTAATNAGAKVVSYSKKGKGNMTKKLWSTILKELPESNDFAAIMTDGDLTYRIDDLKPFLDKIEQGYDMVVGKRIGYFKENKKPINKFGNRFYRCINRLFVNKSIEDPFSGFRVFSPKLFRTYPCNVEGFEIEADLNMYTKHMKVCCLPIRYSERPEDSYSKITIKDGLNILRHTFKHIKAN